MEHFTRTAGIASIVPAWMPWHRFWAYFVGACFIAAPLSLATGIRARLSASLLGLTFFLFVVLMDVPGWARQPANPFAVTLALRELAFSGGALALAASLTRERRRAHLLAVLARGFVAIAVLWFGIEQFLHADHVPAIPLGAVTPPYVYGHFLWPYLAGVIYVVAGTLLIVGWHTRVAAMWLAVTVLVIEVAVYVPIAVVERASLDRGFNFMADTLMFAGALLLLAGAMPRAAVRTPQSTAATL